MAGRAFPSALRQARLAVLLWLAATATATGALAGPLPPRPTAGHGSDFYLLAGVEAVELDLDPRGSADFVAAGLDLDATEPGLCLGVGWTFRRPLRLGLTATAWRVDVDRPDADAMLARAAAELHLAVLEGGAGSLEATVSAAFLIIDYALAGQDEHLPGSSVGVGATGRLRLLGPLGLGASYQFQLGRFEPKTFALDDGSSFRAHPTARLHGLRLTLYLDL
jgi:hypothetical protein